MKVVIHAEFGGFHVNLGAARWMAARGHAYSIERVTAYDKKLADPSLRNDYEVKWGVHWYEYGYDRTDPMLVEAVETLGDEAGCHLKVVEIPDGIEWEIDDYDGYETIHEKHRSWG